MEIIAVLICTFGVLFYWFYITYFCTSKFKVNWSDGSDSITLDASSNIYAYEKFLHKHNSLKNLAVKVTHVLSGSIYKYDSHLENLNLKGDTLIPLKNFPHVGITDRALIAKMAISYFPYDEYEAVVDLLQGQGERRKAIEELNLKIRVNYENFLFEVIGEEFDHNSYKDEIDEEVEKIMQLGIRGILKKYGADSINESVEDVSREIKSSESWDEIKRRL